jgi:hypothetical protein
MKKLLFSLLLLIMTTIQGQISKNFGKEVKALIEADVTDLMMNEIKSEYSSTFYRTDLKLEGFEVSYIVSGIIGNVLSAKYLKKGNEDLMDGIYDQLNTIPYLIFDSKTRPEMIKKSDTNLTRKIFVKSRENGKTVLIITLHKSDDINLLFLD